MKFIQYSPEEARKFFEMAETFLGGVREFLWVR